MSSYSNCCLVETIDGLETSSLNDGFPISIMPAICSRRAAGHSDARGSIGNPRATARADRDLAPSAPPNSPDLRLTVGCRYVRWAARRRARFRTVSFFPMLATVPRALGMVAVTWMMVGSARWAVGSWPAAGHQFERDGSQPRRATQDVVRRAFEAAGVEFIDENGGGAGVRLGKPRK